MVFAAPPQTVRIIFRTQSHLKSAVRRLQKTELLA